MPEEIESILDYELDSVPELGPVTANEEYLLEIRGVPRVKKSKDDAEKPWKLLSVRLTLPDEETAEDIYYAVWLPTDEDDIKTRNEKLDKYRKFLQAFDVDTSQGVELSELTGKQSWGIIGMGEGREGQPQNIVSSFLRPA